MTMVYGDLKVPGRRKNKAKQSQLPNFGDFAFAISLAKVSRKQEISVDKQRYKNGQDTLKTAILADQLIAPRGFEPLLPG